MKLSVFGELLDLFEKSGLNGKPIITDFELKKLHNLIITQILIAEDISDIPLKSWLESKQSQIEGMIYARNLT